MSQVNFTTKEKNKHLELQHYEHIGFELVRFHTEVKSGKTVFMRKLAEHIGTSLGNLYKIIQSGTIDVLSSELIIRKEFSPLAAFNARRKFGKTSNQLKLEKAKPFIDKVCAFVLENKKINSIDEAVHRFKDDFDVHVCTKTIYNYVHKDLIALKKIDCPEIVGRKPPRHLKIAKRHKGTSIDERPEEVDNRNEFGHWEGDLVVGSRKGETGALLTLLERKTRQEIALPIKNKTSKQVFMAINKLEKQFEDLFPKVFKSITFDNGSEFARFKDIEKHPKAKHHRTKVYFAHPYASWERGSNENANKLIRRFFPKGINFNEIPKQEIQDAISLINNKKRKVLDYKSAQELFDIHLSLLFA